MVNPAAAPAAAAGGGAPLGEAFFARSPLEVAPALLGCILQVGAVTGRIVETEAYRDDDPASHSFRGPRGRARVMFGPPGRLYVYRSYGIHWCVNLVSDREGSGAAVLLRAVEPRDGIAHMRARRGAVADRLLCSGPGRLTQAMGIDGTFDGLTAVDPAGPVRVLASPGPVPVVSGPRVGITKATDRPWRFGVAGSPYLSRPFATAPEGDR